jgi:hypothetical protein
LDNDAIDVQRFGRTDFTENRFFTIIQHSDYPTFYSSLSLCMEIRKHLAFGHLTKQRKGSPGHSGFENSGDIEQPKSITKPMEALAPIGCRRWVLNNY